RRGRGFTGSAPAAAGGRTVRAVIRRLAGKAPCGEGFAGTDEAAPDGQRRSSGGHEAGALSPYRDGSTEPVARRRGRGPRPRHGKLRQLAGGAGTDVSGPR